MNTIIGQDEVRQQLARLINAGRMPHALLLAGPEGNGAYGIALEVAARLLGAPAMMAKLQHPDLHLSFPVYKKDSKPTTSDTFVRQWRDMVLQSPYFGYAEWMDAIGAENQQLTIYVEESEALLRKLSLKANQGGYKVSIIWLPEKMNAECANKLLKLLEEPPQYTIFILVSEHPEQLLTTVRSRCQTIDVPPHQTADIQQTLVSTFHVDTAQAESIARAAYGNVCAAIRMITDNSEAEQFIELFKSLMRLSYMRKVKEMKAWADEVAGMGRERQKRFLNYCQRMVRENFIYNFHMPQLNYMSTPEAEFAVRFAPYINERNVIGIADELQLCYRDIAQNANPKIVFFDFALKMIVLIKNR